MTRQKIIDQINKQVWDQISNKIENVHNIVYNQVRGSSPEKVFCETDMQVVYEKVWRQVREKIFHQLLNQS